MPFLLALYWHSGKIYSVNQHPFKALVVGSSPTQPMPSNHSVTRINKGSTGDYPLSVHCERMLPEMHENA